MLWGGSNSTQSLCLCAALSEKTGRKPSIMIGGLIFIIGGALQSAAFFVWSVITIVTPHVPLDGHSEKLFVGLQLVGLGNQLFRGIC